MSEKKKSSAQIINPGLGDIEKVRDILFGRYVDNFEQRFTELEERLEKDVNTLKDRLTDKINGLDSVVAKAVDDIHEKLASENETRNQVVQETQGMLDKAQTRLQHTISLLEDQSNQDLNALKSNLAEAQNDFLDNLEQVKQELSKQSNDFKEVLNKDKVGRETLALMLDEVAIKLRGQKTGE